MADATPTVLERIKRLAMNQAYFNARRLGYEPTAAYREAHEVGAFIANVPAHNPRDVLPPMIMVSNPMQYFKG